MRVGSPDPKQPVFFVTQGKFEEALELLCQVVEGEVNALLSVFLWVVSADQ